MTSHARRWTGAFFALFVAGPSFAAEGAASRCLPDAGGDMLLAAPPEPGLTVACSLWCQSGDVWRAALGGQVRAGLDLDLAAASYASEAPVLGGRHAVAAPVPFGRADGSASLVGPGGGRIDRSGDRFDLSDIAFVPIQLNWNTGAQSCEVSHAIIASIAGHDVGRATNLGRDYRRFDTAAPVTWFDPEVGREVSVAPGIMLDTENPDADHRAGAEFHMDFTATQRLAPTFALVLRGYWRGQVMVDGGAGATLGDLKSESAGIGAGFLWTPACAERRLSVLGKWIRDVRAENRFEPDYAMLTSAWKV